MIQVIKENLWEIALVLFLCAGTVIMAIFAYRTFIYLCQVVAYYAPLYPKTTITGTLILYLLVQAIWEMDKE